MGTTAPDPLTGIKVDMRMGRAMDIMAQEVRLMDTTAPEVKLMDIAAPEVRLMGITAPEDFLIHRMKINYLRNVLLD